MGFACVVLCRIRHLYKFKSWFCDSRDEPAPKHDSVTFLFFWGAPSLDSVRDVETGLDFGRRFHVFI